MGVGKKQWLSEGKQTAQYTESKQLCVCCSCAGRGSAWECRRLSAEWVTGQIDRMSPRAGRAQGSLTTGLGACIGKTIVGKMFFLTKISLNVWPSWDDCFFVFFFLLETQRVTFRWIARPPALEIAFFSTLCYGMSSFFLCCSCGFAILVTSKHWKFLFPTHAPGLVFLLWKG